MSYLGLNEHDRRATSVYIPTTCDTYGPKAILKKNNEDILIQDPLSQRLTWTTPPSVVLVIKKTTNTLDKVFCEIIEYLITVRPFQNGTCARKRLD